MDTLKGLGLALGFIVALSARVAAETWPTRPVQVVVPAGAGGVTDGIARVVAQSLRERLGQAFVVENRPGGNGIVGVTSASKASPDGYTLMIGTNTTMAANNFLYKTFTVDPLRDFAPLAVVVDTPMSLVVPPNSPFNSVRELVAAAKAQPGRFNYGAGTSSALLCTEFLKAIAGIDLVKVTYRSSPQALVDLLAGRLDLLCEPLAGGRVNASEGKLKMLALAGAQRSSLAPDLPTIAEAGFPGMDYSAWIAFWAPSGTPPEITKRLSAEIVSIMREPGTLKRMADLGSDLRIGGPDVLHALQRAEIEKIGILVKQVGIVAE